MKILIVNAMDLSGGAARAAYRLHKSLLDQNIESQMIVQTKASKDITILGHDSTIWKGLNKLRSIIDRIPVRFYKNRTKMLFSPSWLGFNNLIDVINKTRPDIVHLHWINHGMIRIEDLKRIKAPIVWSLHDNWPFTGGCHIMWDCERYIDKCGQCPRLGSDKENDLSRWIWNRKRNVYNSLDNLTIIGLSKWILESSQKSSLLINKRHINLPNPIDTSSFKPLDKAKARELWNLPKSKKLILFGAMYAIKDINKGYEKLKVVLDNLEDDNVEFVVFGSGEPKVNPGFKFKAHYVGYIRDDIRLATLYSAADVMVVPSLQENLSYAIMESLSCATPVVAFNIGGNSDMIEHKNNGYLAEAYDTSDMAHGIDWILNNEKYSELCQNARKKVLNEFESSIVAKKYIKMYEDILKNNSNKQGLN